MIFDVKYNQKKIGRIDLRQDGFSTEGITEENQKKILQSLFDLLYKDGLTPAVGADHPSDGPITAKDDYNKFILETDLKLNELGYSLE